MSMTVRRRGKRIENKVKQEEGREKERMKTERVSDVQSS